MLKIRSIAAVFAAAIENMMNLYENEKLNMIRHGLYIFSVLCMIFCIGLAFLHAPFTYLDMDFFASVLSQKKMTVMMVGLSLLLSALLFILAKTLTKKSDGVQKSVLAILALIVIYVQFALLFRFRVILRYDHLQVFDQALAMFKTGEISGTFSDSYFAQYPFNIPITIFNYLVLNLAKLIGIPEMNYMLFVHGVYVIGIDLGVYLSYKLLTLVKSQKSGTIFMLMVFLDPVVYLYGFGCYTTILMIPCLMANLYVFTLMLKAAPGKKKVIYGVILGIVFILGTKIRANLLITAITFAGYLILRRKPDYEICEGLSENPEAEMNVAEGELSAAEKKPASVAGLKRLAILALAVVIGGGVTYAGCMALENHFVKFDYTDTQDPIPYYFYFSAKLESMGSYNEEDYAFINQFDTLEEKKHASWVGLFERYKENGLKGNARLADHKLAVTWSDGVDDYVDFARTAEHYDRLYDYIAGSRKDIFALYCHAFNLMALFYALLAAVFMLRKKCDTPFYMIGLNLLGAMMFHVLWESGQGYSISFFALVLLLAEAGFEELLLSVPENCSDRKEQRAFERICQRCADWSGILGLVIVIAMFAGQAGILFKTPYKQMHNAAVQDMASVEDLEILRKGEVVTQTFVTGRRFDHVGVKVLNPLGVDNQSVYNIEILNDAGTLIAQKQFSGGEVVNKDYVYVRVDTVTPVYSNEEFTIRITGVEADDEHNLTFMYYNSHNWDMYPGGKMSGLNADPKSDLTFVVYEAPQETFLP